jgi:hypothetical protein
MHPIQQLYPRCGIALALAFAVVSASAEDHTAYLCKAPPTAADKQACAFARLDRPDELRRFIERTHSIYSLYMPNYVAEQDVERWDQARRDAARPSVTAVATRESEKVGR